MKTEKIMQQLTGKSYQEVIAHLAANEDGGDCCGFASVEVSDYVKAIEGADSAPLREVVKIEYDESEGERVVVNFIFDIGGDEGVILGYELTAGSGSGWHYGAYCSLKYGDEEVASASW